MIMSDSKNSVNFSANTVDGLITKDNIKYHEKIDKCALSTAFKEVTKTEAHNRSTFHQVINMMNIGNVVSLIVIGLDVNNDKI